MQNKICLRCSKSSKDVPFTVIKATGKYRARCKSCSNIEQKENREANIDSRRIREQQYRDNNRDQIRTQYKSKKYANEQYLKNKESILKRHSQYNKNNATDISKQKHEYYLKNKEHICKRSSEYFMAHRDEYYARNSKRRALMLNAVPKWLTTDELGKINLLYKITRKVQDLTGVNMHVDHIYPLNGKTVCGFHCLSNLQILTAKENMEKSNKFPDEKYLKEP